MRANKKLVSYGTPHPSADKRLPPSPTGEGFGYTLNYFYNYVHPYLPLFFSMIAYFTLHIL